MTTPDPMKPLAKALAVALVGAGLALGAPVLAGEAAGKLITRAEKEIIESFFDDRSGATKSGGKTKQVGKAKDKGKGKAKGAKELPKGIAMKLERGGSLPPGIDKRPLPRALTSQLPRRPSGQEYSLVDDNVVLVEKTTGKILDIVTSIGEGRR